MIFIPTANEQLARDMDSLYVYMPEGTTFSIGYMHLDAICLKNKDALSKYETVYLTKDGWIWKDEWEIITAMTTRPVISNEDGLWRYKHNASHYPFMTCKKINWTELELKHLFS